MRIENLSGQWIETPRGRRFALEQRLNLRPGDTLRLDLEAKIAVIERASEHEDRDDLPQ